MINAANSHKINYRTLQPAQTLVDRPISKENVKVGGTIFTRGKFLDFFSYFGSVSDQAVEYPYPLVTWLPDLKKTNLDMLNDKGELPFDEKTGELALPKRFSWTLADFRYLHVMTKPGYSKAWIIPVQGDDSDMGPFAGKDGNVHLKLSESNAAKYLELKEKGYTSRGVWVQRRTGKRSNPPVLKLLSDLQEKHKQGWNAYHFITQPFIGQWSYWIQSEIEDPSSDTTVIRQWEDGGKEYLMYFRQQTNANDKHPRNKPLLMKVITGPNGAIRQLNLATDMDWIKLLFRKLPNCERLWMTLENIIGMMAEISDEAEKNVVSEPENNKLIINPKSSDRKGGVLESFMDIMWSCAFHLLWHGDDPNTSLTEEKAEVIWKDILNTPFEKFKKDFHTLLGKASFFTLTFLRDYVGNENNSEFIYPLVWGRKNFFLDDSGKSILGQVQSYYRQNQPDKVGQLLDPTGEKAQKLYNILKKKAEKPNPPQT